MGGLGILEWQDLEEGVFEEVKIGGVLVFEGFKKLGNYVYDICRLMIGRFKFCRMMRYEVVVFNFLFMIYC